MKRYLPLSEIQIDEASRQRKEVGDVSDLKESISRVGLINPITLEDKTNRLIAGRRRLQAMMELGWDKIPVTFKSELDEITRQLIELDENVRRKDLSWKEQATAIHKYHELLGGTLEKTSDALGYASQSTFVSQAVIVGRALSQGDRRIEGATGITGAYNILDRVKARQIDAEVGDIIGTIHKQAPSELHSQEPKPKDTPASPVISQGDFLKFSQTYSGRPFNLIHCDFPYGINHDKSDLGGMINWDEYADSPDVYWSLCKSLVGAKDRLMFPSAHIVFWFSLTFYQETLDFFTSSGFAVQPFPLIWHKTDSKGILPDPNRGPRRVYETAFLMSIGDRKIIRAVDNAYGCPSSKSIHISEKPEPMLKHFFSMLVDGLTEILDPTCGSGNALLAASRLGASRVMGLELNPEMAEAAQVNFKREKSKDFLAEKVNV